MDLFSVEDTTAQVVWGNAPPGPIAVSLGGRVVEVPSAGGPGGVVVDGLAPAAPFEVAVRASTGAEVRLQGRTLAAPPGRLLCRIGTVSDLHVGSGPNGWFRTIRDRSGLAEPPAVRCTSAASADAVRWGAELMVVKGDLTENGLRSEWDEVLPLLRSVAVPLEICPGNHDTRASAEVGPRDALAAAGLPCADPVSVRDLPGVRVVTVDSTVPGRSPGSVRRALPDLLDALAGTDLPALVCIHHPFEPLPAPSQYPVGIPWPESRRALAAIRRSKRDVLVTTGHTHRNRRLRFGPLVQAEVAAVKDYPGVWAGYAVHEGGIRQVVRRLTTPETMAWTEASRRAFAGAWRAYAPGRARHRSFVVPWGRPG